MPALFIAPTMNYIVADMWRFWIIHLWVEGCFELFATAMVAIMYFLLGIVSRKTALRVIAAGVDRPTVGGHRTVGSPRVLGT